MKRSVLDYLENTAKRCPERLAWDASAPFTFGQWWDAAQRIASSLSSRCARNTPVAVLMNPRSAECVKVFFGVWAAGCFYAPLDPMLPPERLKLIMQNLEPTTIVYDEESRAKADAVCPDGCECVLWSDAAQSPVDADKLAQIRQTVTPDHLAAILVVLIIMIIKRSAQGTLTKRGRVAIRKQGSCRQSVKGFLERKGVFS